MGWRPGPPGDDTHAATTTAKKKQRPQAVEVLGEPATSSRHRAPPPEVPPPKLPGTNPRRSPAQQLGALGDDLLAGDEDRDRGTRKFPTINRKVRLPPVSLHEVLADTVEVRRVRGQEDADHASVPSTLVRQARQVVDLVDDRAGVETGTFGGPATPKLLDPPPPGSKQVDATSAQQSFLAKNLPMLKARLHSMQALQEDKRRRSSPKDLIIEKAREHTRGRRKDAIPPVAKAEEPAAGNPDRALYDEVCKALGMGGALPGDALPHDKKKKDKKKKRSKRRHRRRSSSSSSSNSRSSSSSSFRLATSRGAGRENAIRETARLKPGKLFTEGLRTMNRYCDPSSITRSGEDPNNGMPPSAYRYLTTLVEVAGGMNLGRRDRRELQTLAVCLDSLAAGKLNEVGDILMQRFKAVETASSSKSWELAQHLELVPGGCTLSTTTREQEVAAKLMLRDAALQAQLQKRGGKPE